MKILHFSDLHLGIERYGHAHPQTGLSTRLHDFLAALDRIIDIAIEEHVDVVLFTGDAYKNREPTPTVQREFARRLRRLHEADIPLVLLIGNHDLPSAFGRATSLSIFHALSVPGIYVADQITTLRLETRAGPLQVVTLPWVHRTHVLPRDEFRDVSMGEVQQRLIDLVGDLLRQQVAALDPALPAVLCAHATILGATYGSERSVMLGQDLVFTRSDLQAGAFDYIALGHIHRHQAVGEAPPAVYAGSPERIDFGEEREPKGFVMLSIETGADGRRQAHWEFRTLPARPFVTLRLTASGSDPQGDLERAIARASQVEGAITRVLVRVMPEAAGQVRPLDVRRALRAAGAGYIAAVHLEPVAEEDRPSLPLDASEALEPMRMLERYLDARQVAGPRRAQLLELAARLTGGSPEAPPPSPSVPSE